MAGDVGVGVEGGDAFGGGDPALGGAVLLVVDARVAVVVAMMSPVATIFSVGR